MIAGRYSLEHEIGRGGMGAVWLGRDELLGRQVALKRIGLLPGTDGTDLARAEREARLGAQLHHPNVVSVFDVVAEEGSDARWLVMEYVEGVTLAQLVRDRGSLSPDEVAGYARQVADALVAAHAAGIAHRDVKPSNVMVDPGNQAKLTDFGIARIAADPTLTQTGMVTGSPSYLAPEVVSGSRGDESSDVWSLGATMYHLLEGHPPYPIGDHLLGALYRIANEEPPRPADAGWLTPVLEGTMVKDPAQRWSMVEVRDFLASRGARTGAASHTRVLPAALQTLSSEPVGPSEPSEPIEPIGPVVPVTRSRARNRPSGTVLLVGGLAVAVLLALLLYAVLHDGRSSQSTASQADTPSKKTTPSKSPTESPSKTPARPTAQGMESFIRDYVSTVAADPDAAWKMLTPKFQRESGGIAKYRAFWGRATDGRVLSISADPANLSVSYQVRFDNFDNGPGPTVLDLKFDNGRYRIDGERSAGFVPAG